MYYFNFLTPLHWSLTCMHSANKLAQVQWGHKPVDLWDITFWSHWFWGSKYYWHPWILRPRALFYRTDCTSRSKFIMHALAFYWNLLHIIFRSNMFCLVTLKICSIFCAWWVDSKKGFYLSRRYLWYSKGIIQTKT